MWLNSRKPFWGHLLNHITVYHTHTICYRSKWQSKLQYNLVKEKNLQTRVDATFNHFTLLNINHCRRLLDVHYKPGLVADAPNAPFLFVLPLVCFPASLLVFEQQHTVSWQDSEGEWKQVNYKYCRICAVTLMSSCQLGCLVMFANWQRTFENDGS